MNSSPQPAALLVLGMHRSGTSAMSGMLGLAGVYSGPELLPGHSGVNPKGYFEHAAIVACHERMLAALGSMWHDERPLPAGWWKEPSIQTFRQELAGLVRSDFAGRPLWLLKDPRLCRLLPLWKAVLGELGIRPHYLEVLRHPLEVARSIAVRDGIHQERACLLWLVHLVECLEQIREAQPCFVTFDDLLSDWRAVLRRIGDELQLEWPPPTPAQASDIDHFLEPQLRHHRTSDAAAASAGEIAAYASKVYLALRQDPRAATGSALFEELAQATRGFSHRVAAWSAEITDIHLRLALQDRIVARQAAELHWMRRSWSWRLTKPLRLLIGLTRKGGDPFEHDGKDGRGGEI